MPELLDVGDDITAISARRRTDKPVWQVGTLMRMFKGDPTNVFMQDLGTVPATNRPPKATKPEDVLQHLGAGWKVESHKGQECVFTREVTRE